MHKNNRIYLLNILNFSQPCLDWLNRTQAYQIVSLDCRFLFLSLYLLLRTWQPLMFAFMSCVFCLSSLPVSLRWTHRYRITGEWSKEKKDIKEEEKHSALWEGKEEGKNRYERDRHGKKGGWVRTPRQSELRAIDKCQCELHRPSELSSAS